MHHCGGVAFCSYVLASEIVFFYPTLALPACLHENRYSMIPHVRALLAEYIYFACKDNGPSTRTWRPHLARTLPNWGYTFPIKLVHHSLIIVATMLMYHHKLYRSRTPVSPKRA